MNVKLVVLDIDGVLCDGKFYGVDGNVIGKTFCDIDWTAIKMFKAVGISVVFLSGDKMNAAIAEKRNIPFYHSRSDDGLLNKGEAIRNIMSEYGVSRHETAYVGDDTFDLEAMKEVEAAFCPLNAAPAVRRSAVTIYRRSGQGVVAGLFDMLCGTYCISMNRVKSIDAEES